LIKFFLVLAIFLVSFSSASEKKQNLEKISLQLHWKYQFEFAGFIAAKEKGFYEDVGLDVELKEYEFGIDIEKDVLNGKSEYGIYNSLSLLEYLRGKPLVLVSSYFKRAALVLVTTPDIKSPKGLVGKKIMASTKEDFILNYQPYFDRYGMSVDDVELVPHTYDVKGFINGEVSAMTAFVSNELYKLDDAGIKYNVLDPSNENLYVLQLELITSLDEVTKHPSRVLAFREASLKGWEYALSHKEELADIIYNKYSNKYNKKDILKEAGGVEKLILPYTYNIGSIDTNFLQKQIKLFKESYKVGLDKKLDKFIFKTPETKTELFFSRSEQEFIKNHQEISLCAQFDLFPVDGFVDGNYVGMMSDLYEIISQKTSLKFNAFYSDSFESLAEKINTHKCDILSVYETKSREFRDLKATTPFTQTHFTLISRLDKSFIDAPYLLKNKVLITQYKSYKKYLKFLYPYLTIKVMRDKNRMIDMVLDDEVYAIITIDEESDYLIDKYGYGKLKINGFLLKEHPLDVSIGVQKENPILYSIIEKTLNSISKEEIRELINSWRITRYHSVQDYSLVIKVIVVMFIIFLIMMYYQNKLHRFNKELESVVFKKTKELRDINESLSEAVEQKVKELIAKDEILTAQSKQAVMGEMISMIAHQWRQPLNTITLNLSNLQIKQMMGQKIDNDVLNNTIDEITATISYLSETIDDFKTYFHPNKEKSSADIDEVIEKAIHFVISRAKSAKIEMIFNEKSMCVMQVYSNELIQVLLNILNNAIDAYIDKDIADKKIEIITKEEDGFLSIAIKDEAGGIKSETISQLFEPYFSTKGKNGTGLGLYMSQMIIEKQFNGMIEVESINASSKFTIKLPMGEKF